MLTLGEIIVFSALATFIAWCSSDANFSFTRSLIAVCTVITGCLAVIWMVTP